MTTRPGGQPSQQAAEEAPPKGIRGALAAFESSNFRILFAGRVSSNMARQMRVFLRAWMTLELTNSPFLMGVVASSLAWPMLVVPFLGGVLADRMNRKTLLLWTEGALTVLWAAVAITVFLGAKDIGPAVLRVQWWHFIITSFISGVIQSIGRPGHQAMIGSVVSKKLLPNAVALNSVSDTWPRVGGPAIGAVAVALVGGPWQTWGPWLFGLTAAGQLFTFITIMMLKPEPSMDVSKQRKRRSMWGDFVDGLKIIKSDSVLSAIVVLGLTFTVLAGGAGFLLPVFARDVLGGGSEGGAVIQGVLNTAATVGSSIGALIILWLVAFRRRGLLLLGIGLVHAVSVIAFSQSTMLALSIVLVSINSLTGTFFRTTQRMLMQLMAPDHMRGRIMSIDTMQDGLSPIGVLLWGAIAQVLQAHYGLAQGTQTTWLLGGIMYGLVAVLYFIFVPAIRKFR
ncbi:MAG: MFS transporter [Chloroflexi bacterium]|nr:MFS transporter [Chloroflexota bacterium]